MVTLQEYFGKFFDHPDATPERKDNAKELLSACEKLEVLAKKDGVKFQTNPMTNSQVSGTRYGGFRPQDCLQGASRSSHKEGLAVDLFDPDGDIDEWCLENLDKLEQCGIYLENPAATVHWSHWTIRAPKSGKRVFMP